jgi:putative PIN family toxin of toxin-antitoxin system
MKVISESEFLERTPDLLLNTNILVSAALAPAGVPARCVSKALTEFVVLSSHAAQAELWNVLQRRKFDRQVPLEVRHALFNFLTAAQTLVEVIAKVTDCRDPKDNIFLELALSGDADFIVTGDNDLLMLDPWRGIRIVTSSSFLVM